MFQTKSSLALVFSAIFLMSCGSQKKERPSPLRSDSMALGSGTVKIEFSSPAANGREIWGDLVPFDQIWRTGANDASFLSADIPIKINGAQLDSGSYAIFTIPTEDKWQIILNEKWNQWGTYHYDSTLNVADFSVRPTEEKEFSERMRFYFENDSLKFHWANLTFSLPLEGL